MILIGNGPVPFAAIGPQQAGGRPDGIGRTASAGPSPTAAATIPAASQAPAASAPAASRPLSGSAAVQAILASSRTGRTVTDPDELAPAEVRRRSQEAGTEGIGPRPAPAPPLTQFATIPSAVMAEIQRLREEIRELRQRLDPPEAKTSAPDPSGQAASGTTEEQTTPGMLPNEPPADRKTPERIGLSNDVDLLRRLEEGAGRALDTQR